MYLYIFGALGYFSQFSPSMSKVDIDALVVRYADPTYWHQAIQDEVESNIC
jgi:hypothetical protein